MTDAYVYELQIGLIGVTCLCGVTILAFFLAKRRWAERFEEAIAFADRAERERTHVVYRELQEFQKAVEAIKAAKAAVPVPKLDDTTAKLVRLALNNPSENEANNAALAVCRRLQKQMKP